LRKAFLRKNASSAEWHWQTRERNSAAGYAGQNSSVPWMRWRGTTRKNNNIFKNLSNYSTIMASKKSDVDAKVLRFFSAVADGTRLKMMDGERTVGAIYEKTGREKMSLSAVSHQLKYLEQVGVVKFDKKGREKFFRLSEDFCWCILRDAYAHFSSDCSCKKCINEKTRKGR
jgi:DNA-binding transcriptional ArsR family regulator